MSQTPYGAIYLSPNSNSYGYNVVGLANAPNYLLNVDFSNGISPWVVTNPTNDILVNNGRLTNSTQTDTALYLADLNDQVTQTIDPSVYDFVEPQHAFNNDAYWWYCFDAKADPVDQIPFITASATESNQGSNTAVPIQITTDWGKYCSIVYTEGSSATTIPGVMSVSLTNTLTNSSGTPVGVSVDKITLQRYPAVNYAYSPQTTSTTISAALTVTNTDTVQQVAATTTQTSFQFATAAANDAKVPVNTITATDVVVETVTKDVGQKTRTITRNQASKTVTVSNCAQTLITFGQKCCPNKICKALNDVLDRSKNRYVSAITATSTNYFATQTNVAFTFITNSATVTVPITNTVAAVQTITIPGQAAPAVVHVERKTSTVTVTPAATLTKTVYRKPTKTSTVYQCDDRVSRSVTCPANARSAKALASFGKNSLKNANSKARKAGNPSVEIQCAGSDTIYQC